MLAFEGIVQFLILLYYPRHAHPVQENVVILLVPASCRVNMLGHSCKLRRSLFVGRVKARRGKYIMRATGVIREYIALAPAVSEQKSDHMPLIEAFCAKKTW